MNTQINGEATLSRLPATVKEEKEFSSIPSTDCQFSCLNSNNNSVKENCVDVSTQTEADDIAKVIDVVVKHRIEQLAKTSSNNKDLDLKISTIIRRLFDEQVKLKLKADQLEAKLQKYENEAGLNKKRKSNPQTSNPINATSYPANVSKRPPIQMVSPVPQATRFTSTAQDLSFYNNSSNQRQVHPNNLLVNANSVTQMTYSHNANITPRGPYPLPNIPGQLPSGNIRDRFHMMQYMQNDASLTQPAMMRWQVQQQNSHNRLPLHNLAVNKPLNNSSHISNRSVDPNNMLNPEKRGDPPSYNSTHVSVSFNTFAPQANVPANTFALQANVPANTFAPQAKQVSPVAPPPEVSVNRLPNLKAKISASSTGIILTWDYESPENPENYKVECYQLYANQAKDASVTPPSDPSQWKKIGIVNALPLPMACTLTQITNDNVYHFTVVAVDINGVEGKRSNPCTMRLSAS